MRAASAHLLITRASADGGALPDAVGRTIENQPSVPRSRFSAFWPLVGSCPIQLARSRTPTSSIVVRIWSCADCTAEASITSSRSSTSPRSCSHFLATKGSTATLDATRWFIFRGGRLAERGAQAGATRPITLGRTVLYRGPGSVLHRRPGGTYPYPEVLAGLAPPGTCNPLRSSNHKGLTCVTERRRPADR